VLTNPRQFAVKSSMSLGMIAGISATPPTSRFMMQKQVVNRIQNYLEKRKRSRLSSWWRIRNYDHLAP